MIKIETKYDINQEVWFIENSKVVTDIIETVSILKQEDSLQIFYYFKNNNHPVHWERKRIEDEVFATKEELIQSL